MGSGRKELYKRRLMQDFLYRAALLGMYAYLL